MILFMDDSGAAAGSLPTFVVSSALLVTSTTSTFSLGWDTGYAIDDVALVFVESSNQVPGAVAGWTKVAEHAVGGVGAAGAAAVSIYACAATSLAMAPFSLTNPGVRWSGIMAIYRGVDNVNPIDVYATTDGTTGSLVLPAVTTTGGNRKIVGVFGDGRDASSSTRYSSWNYSGVILTERFDGGTTSNSGGGIGVADGDLVSAGSTGTGGATFALTSTNFVGITLALKPA